MTAQELRVGNLVATKDKNTLAIIDGIHLMGEMTSCKYFNCEKWALIGLDDLQPIPLSEDWLRRLGFEERENKWFEKKYFSTEDCDDVNLILLNVSSNRCNITTVDSECGGSYAQLIKYVHQLQNLIYVLSGEELKLKEE